MQNKTVKFTEFLLGGLIVYDSEWRVTSLNEQAAQILGKSQKELLDQNFWRICPEFIGSIFYQKCYWTFTHHSACQFEEFLLNKGWFEFYTYPTQTGLIVYLQNITERKQLETSLYHQNSRVQTAVPHSVGYPEQNWKALLDKSPDIFCQFDRHLRYVYVNPAIEKATGLTPAQLIGKTHAELGLCQPIYFRWDEMLRCAFETGQEQSIELEFSTPEGLRIYQSRVVPEVSDRQITEYVLVLSRDITEDKRIDEQRAKLIREQAARAEAERANRIKDEFLAVLSHELRSPLNPILGWAKLLQMRPYDSTTLNRALEIIERNARIQAQLIEDLLDVSRILQGKIHLKECPVNLALTLEAALDTVRLAADAKGINIITYCPAEIDEVLGDPDRLQQIIWNLLSNAIKFTPNGGQVDIQLEQIESQVQITISDNGEGITPDFLPHVFDSFRQADSSMTRASGGLGLGLAIVRHLVELHGGTITAASPGKGLGASFTVVLPVKSPEFHPLQQHRPVVKSASLENVRVLIVDDEVDSRELVAFLLTEQGAIATTAGSAAEAIQAFRQSQPDLLICDIGMPEVDGYTLLDQIKALNLRREIVAIALTAYATTEDQQRAYQAGFQHHVAKPIEPQKFTALIADISQSIP